MKNTKFSEVQIIKILSEQNQGKTIAEKPPSKVRLKKNK